MIDEDIEFKKHLYNAFIYGMATGNLHNVKYSFHSNDIWIVNFIDYNPSKQVMIIGPNYHGKSQYWYYNYMRHRIDGPAEITSFDGSYYYINDKELDEQEFIQWQQDNNIPTG